MKTKKSREHPTFGTWCRTRSWLEEQKNLSAKVKIRDTQPWQKERIIYNPKLVEKQHRTKPNQTKKSREHPTFGTWCRTRSWLEEQKNLSAKVKIRDTQPWQKERIIYNPKLDEKLVGEGYCLRYVAGFDVSFVKDSNLAVAGLYVFDISQNMKIVYRDVDRRFVKMEVPYQSGLLAYREAPFLIEKLHILKMKRKDLYPQCIFVDGNGVLHERRFGLACHVGYHTGIPTIGCAKTFHLINGLRPDKEHKKKVEALTNVGDYFKLEVKQDGKKPELVGYCYKSSKKSKNPIFVSVGNYISWETCLWVLKKVIRQNRIPEPIRKVDFSTRLRVKQLLGEEYQMPQNNKCNREHKSLVKRSRYT